MYDGSNHCEERPMMRVILIVMLILIPNAAFGDQGPNSLAGFGGNWTGSGTLKVESASERFKCRAYNTGTEASLKIALRCSNASASYELRGIISLAGKDVAGTWDLRTYNVTGVIAGKFSGTRLSGTMEGGGYSGKFSVSRTASGLEMEVSSSGKTFVASLGK